MNKAWSGLIKEQRGAERRLVRLAGSFSSYGLGLARSIENWDRSYSG